MKLVRWGMLVVVLGLWAGRSAWALEIVPYDKLAFEQARAARRVTGLLFHSGWCPICVVQERALKSMKDDAELAKVLIFEADFFREDALRTAHKVGSFSTLLVFRGEQERARSTGEIQAAALKALFAKAL